MSRLVAPPGPDDHLLGGAGGLVSLVEYGDYECPSCGQAHRTLELVLARLRGAVLFVYRHFPMTQIHPHALQAAEAAEAAGAQGQFWPMHDTLFENQQALDEASLLEYAFALRLDVDRFSRELSEGVHEARIRRDIRSGVRSGVNGTPTFFVDGVRYDGSWDADSLTRALQLAIRRSEMGPMR